MSILKRFAHGVTLIGLLAIVVLACNLPEAPDSSIPPPPTRGTPPAATVDPDDERTAPAPTATPDASGNPAPTFTPIGGAATPSSGFAPTATLPASAGTPDTPGVVETPTPAANSGPLMLSYTIDWRIDTGNSGTGTAIAQVSLLARGGGGEYRFYRDELPVEGPIFEYPWATCRDNPGSFRVDSADGQSVRINYYEVPPCPTPQP